MGIPALYTPSPMTLPLLPTSSWIPLSHRVSLSTTTCSAPVTSPMDAAMCLARSTKAFGPLRRTTSPRNTIATMGRSRQTPPLTASCWNRVLMGFEPPASSPSWQMGHRAHSTRERKSSSRAAHTAVRPSSCARESALARNWISTASPAKSISPAWVRTSWTTS